MRKFPVFIACILAAVSLVWIAADASSIGVIGGADGPTAVFVASADDDAAPSPSPSPTPMPTAAPVTNADMTIEASIGYDGMIVMNRWSPIFAIVTNNGADFDGTIGVNVFYTTVDYDRYEMPLTVAGGATKRVLIPVKPQVRQDMYAVELVAQDEIVAEKRIAPKRLVAPEAMTIGLLSDEPEALTYLNQRANGLDTLRGEVWVTIPLTADTFPETADLMSGFTMLVVDGIDVRTLSEAQQQVLTSWLAGGGLVYISGGAQAATGYPFFAKWTGLSAGKLQEVEDITPALLEYAGVKGKEAGGTIWLNTIPKANAAISTEDTGLIARVSVGEGMVYVAAFDMGGKPLTSWASMPSVWPRVLRQSAPEFYIKLVNRAEQSRNNYNESYRSRELINSLRVKNTDSGVPVLLILALYLIIVGFGGYLVLKKMDRREWLWVAAPASAIIFALLLLALSGGSSMNKPVTLTASRVSITDEGAQINTYIGVATPGDGELIIATDQEELPLVLRDNDYWYDDSSYGDMLFRPTSMRQRFRLGEDPAVGFAGNSEAWSAKMLALKNLRMDVGTLDTSIWMEADGMHGEAINNSEYAFDHCVVVTSFGFCKLGDLLPGQKVTFEMLYPKEKIDTTAPNFKYKPNILYSSLDFDLTVQGAYYGSDLYSYLNNAIYSETKDGQATPEEETQRMSLVQMFEDEWSFYQSGSAFYFFGFNDKVGQVSISINDEAVTRAAHIAVVGNRVTFEPIGPTGEVMFPQGYIPAEVIVDEGEDKKARTPTDTDGSTDGMNNYGTTDTYLSLGSTAALRFVLPRWGEYDIEKMTLLGMTYEAMPTMYLYNNDKEQWDEQKLLSVSMDGEKWAPYIDEEGGVYVRYVPADASNRYGGMNMPTIALKGEVK